MLEGGKAKLFCDIGAHRRKDAARIGLVSLCVQADQ